MEGKSACDMVKGRCYRRSIFIYLLFPQTSDNEQSENRGPKAVESETSRVFSFVGLGCNWLYFRHSIASAMASFSLLLKCGHLLCLRSFDSRRCTPPYTTSATLAQSSCHARKQSSCFTSCRASFEESGPQAGATLEREEDNEEKSRPHQKGLPNWLNQITNNTNPIPPLETPTQKGKHNTCRRPFDGPVPGVLALLSPPPPAHTPCIALIASTAGTLSTVLLICPVYDVCCTRWVANT